MFFCRLPEDMFDAFQCVIESGVGQVVSRFQLLVEDSISKAYSRIFSVASFSSLVPFHLRRTLISLFEPEDKLRD